MLPILVGGLWTLGTTVAFATKNDKIAYSMTAVGVMLAMAYAAARYDPNAPSASTPSLFGVK